MAQITLNIYGKDKKTVEKTYTAEGYDLMMGTLEDFVQIIDIDKAANEADVAKMIMGAYGQIKLLIRDVFGDGPTEEEWRSVKFNDVIATVMQIATAVLDNLKLVSRGNAPRA